MTDIALHSGQHPDDHPPAGGDPLLRVGVPDLTVTPGAEGRVEVTVLNPTNFVQRYELDVLGAAADWAAVSPASVEMFPGQTAVATVVLRPPRTGSLPPSSLQVGVRARSVVDPSECAVEEFRLDVGAFSEIDAWIRPRQLKLRWRRHFKVVLANNGNVPAALALAGLDPNDALRFPRRPPTVDVAPGSVHVARFPVRVRPRLGGTMEPHQLQIHVLDRNRSRGAAVPGNNPVVATLDALAIRHPLLGSWFTRFSSILTVVAVVFSFIIARQDQDQPGQPTPGGAPPVPADVTVAATAPDAVTVSWTDAGGETGVRVFQQDPTAATSTDASGGCAQCSQVGEVTGQVTTFTVDKLTPSTQYCFRLAAVNGEAISALTAPACTTTPTDAAAAAAAAAADAQAAADAAAQQAAADAAAATAAAAAATAEANKAVVPDAVTATAGEPGTVVVAWNDASAGKASFDVARDGTSVGQVVPGHSSFVASGLTPGTRVCFQVKAVRADTAPPTQSDYSPVADAACAVPTAPLPPCSPTDVAVEPVENAEGAGLRISWSMPATAAAGAAGTPSCRLDPATSFEVQEVYARGAEVVLSPKAGDSAATVTQLLSESFHCYSVRSVLAELRSPASGTACGTAPVIVPPTTVPPPTTSPPAPTTTATP